MLRWEVLAIAWAVGGVDNWREDMDIPFKKPGTGGGGPPLSDETSGSFLPSISSE